MDAKQTQILALAKYIHAVCKTNDIWYSLAAGSVLGAVRHKGFIPWDSDIDIFVREDQIEEFRNVILKDLPVDFQYWCWDKEMKYHPVFDRLSLKGKSSSDIHVDIFLLIGVPDNERKREKFIKKCYYSYRFFRTKHVDIRYSKQSHIRKIKALRVFTSLIPDKIIKKYESKIQHSNPLNQSEYCIYYSTGYGRKACMKKDIVLDTMDVPFEDTVLSIPKDYDTYLKKMYGDYMTPKKENYKLIDQYIR